MRCKLHNRVESMRLGRLSSPLSLACHQIGAIGPSVHPEFSIATKWAKRLQKGAILRTASPIPGTS